MDNKKYELTNETIEYCDITLHRIRALKDFNDVKKGDLGGWIEKEDNLSHKYNCWIYRNAEVYDNAMVFDNARVYNNAEVYDNARVCGNAEVYGNAGVCGDAEVYGDAMVCGNARVFGNAGVCGNARIYNNAYITSSNDYICIGPIGSRNDYTTFYLDKDRNIRVKCGCYNGTIDEFKDRVIEVHKDNKHAKDYLSLIDYIKNVISIKKEEV